MKWSFDVRADSKTAIAAALTAQAHALVANTNTNLRDAASVLAHSKSSPEDKARAQALIDRIGKPQIDHADYVPELEAACRAAEILAAQLPERPGMVITANVHGEIIEGDPRFAPRISATASVALVRERN
jgi:hypothetical protein